jgi:hypothetical protein
MEKPIQTRPEARKEHAERLKALMVELLRCTPAEYNEVQYREGLKYLKSYMSGDPQTARGTLVPVKFSGSGGAIIGRTAMNLFSAFTIRTRSGTCRSSGNSMRNTMTARYSPLASAPNSVVLDETYATDDDRIGQRRNE